MKPQLLIVILLAIPAVTPASRAAIVYSSQQDIPIPLDPEGEYLRLDTGAVAGALPANWVASFCTPHLCAPGHLVLTVPPAGRLRMEFTVVPDTRTRMKVVRTLIMLRR